MLIPSPTRDDLQRLKTQVAAKYGLQKTPSNSEIIKVLTPQERHTLLRLLRRKATRTISGVTVVAVMTKPHPCPQTQPCAYCPGGPSQGVPQSYTGFEPAAMRGAQNDYDPYLQVKARVKQLQAIGHHVDKVELIVMGGTFPATPPEYQAWFIQRCLDAMTAKPSSGLEEAKRNAETSRMRNVGITVETRPDWAREQHVDSMLGMGVTRLELGVQNPDDEIYRLMGRTHTVRDVVEATRTAKDAGLKVAYHLMPGLPGSGREKDLALFTAVFENSGFKPDMIKIYPCLVIGGTSVHSWYLKGAYRPYTTEETTDLLAEIKPMIPPWIRVMRVQRDIPARLIVAGVKSSNLRQIVQQKLREKGLRCRCIRCREVGHRVEDLGVELRSLDVGIRSMTYDASEGTEVFISAEDSARDVLIGYLRLRIPSAKAHRFEVTHASSSIVRELHVCGRLVPVGEHDAEAWQHKGYGASLLAEAERISKEVYGVKKILVTSALGTKRYYMRFGYRRDGVYMSKNLEGGA